MCVCVCRVWTLGVCQTMIVGTESQVTCTYTGIHAFTHIACAMYMHGDDVMSTGSSPLLRDDVITDAQYWFHWDHLLVSFE